MVRCARPGCDRDAEATLGYEANRQFAWLAAGLVGGALPLCAPHADRMAVPRGWTLEDRRHAAPAEDGAGHDDDEGVARWEPRFDTTGDLDVLVARTPLLARAFGRSDPDAEAVPAPSPRRRRSRRPFTEPDS